VTPRPIREIAGADDPSIRTALAESAQPVVLRGLLNDWPCIREARESPAAVAAYLSRFDSGALVDAIMTPVEAGGRIFYNDAMSGFNFIRNRLTISAVAEQVLRYSAFSQAPSVAVQSAPISDCAPGFADENRLTVIDPSIAGRLWLGTAITTPTHIDEWNNIACVAAGRRRFTLFPPEQISNLYIGPLDFAPTGAPMSLVRLDRPDFERFPRFRDALRAAVTAELEPGDALYIPPLWWHNVESLEPFNLLVNYWWHADGSEPLSADSGFDVLLHAILNLRRLPQPTRDAWHALFRHYVFGADEASQHLPPARLGVLGKLSPEGVERVRALLVSRLQRKRRG
jgi:hypothetical protein